MADETYYCVAHIPVKLVYVTLSMLDGRRSNSPGTEHDRRAL